MKFSILQASHNCAIIGSKEYLDENSISAGLELLKRQTKYENKCIIIPDLLLENDKFKEFIGGMWVDRVICIGNSASKFSFFKDIEFNFFSNLNKFITSKIIKQLSFTSVLILGLPKSDFKAILHSVQQKMNRITLEVNLEALKYNLNYFRTYLKPETKLMIMVKALSYGAGAYEIANMLEYQNIDYFGVAVTDEGISLREDGIKLPIVIMNPVSWSYHRLIEYGLEPSIYDIKTLLAFNKIAEQMGQSEYPIHIKIDTGMKRLGFEIDELDKLIETLQTCKSVKPISVFSHMAGSPDPQKHNEFSLQQIEKFKFASNKLQLAFSHKLIRHILNSGGIENYPEAQFDMVRLGIGFYGISSKENIKLHNISTLKTCISQIRNVKKDETIGYDRNGIIDRDSRIAIIPIGYADGLNRKFGNRVGQLSINGQLVPIIGNICMDMCMADITDIDATEGDEVIIFGDEISVTELADKIDTIPYEIMTSVAERVKHVYYTNE